MKPFHLVVGHLPVLIHLLISWLQSYIVLKVDFTASLGCKQLIWGLAIHQSNSLKKFMNNILWWILSIYLFLIQLICWMLLRMARLLVLFHWGVTFCPTLLLLDDPLCERMNTCFNAGSALQHKNAIFLRSTTILFDITFCLQLVNKSFRFSSSKKMRNIFKRLLTNWGPLSVSMCLGCITLTSKWRGLWTKNMLMLFWCCKCTGLILNIGSSQIQNVDFQAAFSTMRRWYHYIVVHKMKLARTWEISSSCLGFIPNPYRIHEGLSFTIGCTSFVMWGQKKGDITGKKYFILHNV